ncbi:hypothetical protein Pla86_50190 [Planctomycetes bacterium Pla86]|uniref:Uncharacterized protein n=1 Tax=Engelhardtia mirabilis TaxID=2528011 RepID=A0A518BSF7_9BACT|nr:hypothetical protein Pla133_50210 [Planctomycetes bacterium Pla133]QDV04224.1 hypothetical protein Pla86_50190 [Planctomycetes bacterium Pla86]
MVESTPADSGLEGRLPCRVGVYGGERPRRGKSVGPKAAMRAMLHGSRAHPLRTCVRRGSSTRDRLRNSNAVARVFAEAHSQKLKFNGTRRAPWIRIEVAPRWNPFPRTDRGCPCARKPPQFPTASRPARRSLPDRCLPHRLRWSPATPPASNSHRSLTLRRRLTLGTQARWPPATTAVLRSADLARFRSRTAAHSARASLLPATSFPRARVPLPPRSSGQAPCRAFTPRSLLWTRPDPIPRVGGPFALRLLVAL